MLTGSMNGISDQIWLKLYPVPGAGGAKQDAFEGRELRPQQSLTQFAQVSVPLQLPSPHVGGQTQSPGQLAHVSVPLQLPSPQLGPLPRGLSAGPRPVGVNAVFVVRSSLSMMKPSSRIQTLMTWVPALVTLIVALTLSSVARIQPKLLAKLPMRSDEAGPVLSMPACTESLVL
jgi:hypothetical protein